MAKLLSETIGLLKARNVSIRQISEDTGLGYDWLNKLAQGKIPNPGVNSVERLNRYLTESPSA